MTTIKSDKENAKNNISKPVQGVATTGNVNFLLIVTIAVVCKIILYYQGFHHLFSNRNEISTPITSFKRVTEGLYLQQQGLSPYSGSTFHLPPLVLLVFQWFDSSWVLAHPQVLYIMIDVLCSLMLRSIAQMVPLKLPKEMKQPLSPNVVVAIYLFNPFSLFTSIGMSTIVLDNMVIIAALYFALQSNLFLAVFCVACAAYLSIYPIILIFPIACLLYKFHVKQPASTVAVIAFSFRIFILFTFSLVSLLYLSFCLFDSWDFIYKCYGFTLLVEDLTPNIGLFWYYFIEVFEHFRNFFLFIFQYHVFIYTIPLLIRLKGYPLFYFWIQCAIISTFKSYPALGDTALHISLLPLLYETLKGVRYSFIILVVGIYVTVLAPILWQMWIYQGTGNANFYYTINLVFTLAQVLLIADSLSVLLKLEYISKLTLLKKLNNNEDDNNNNIIVDNEIITTKSNKKDD